MNLQAIIRPTDQVPSVHGHPVSIQVANGLCTRLPPATLTGVVSSATGPATARHAVGMDNKSKNRPCTKNEVLTLPSEILNKK